MKDCDANVLMNQVEPIRRYADHHHWLARKDGHDGSEPDRGGEQDRNEYNDTDRNRVPHADRILREQAWDESILVPASHRTDSRPARARLTIIYTGRKRFVTLRVAP